jgi:DNA replication and repair protein RecF
MKITNLRLINFRNYTLTELNFPAMINVFFGANAQGKTNLLESIYYGALGLSHRTSNEEELVRFQCRRSGGAGAICERRGYASQLYR